mgnify:CR=1 FL=1
MPDDAQAAGAVGQPGGMRSGRRRFEVHLVEECLEPRIILDRIEQERGSEELQARIADDVPALERADAGIAVSGATDAARAAADIVLLAPGLSTIIEAIHRAREAHTRADVVEDGRPRYAIIFGLEGHGQALARQLRQHGWEVKIASPRAHERMDEVDRSDLEVQPIEDLDLESLEALGADRARAVILTSAGRSAVVRKSSLASVPHAVGVNNHMGSLLTRHPGAMSWLMQALAARGGASVTHCDAAKGVVQWASDNVPLNGLEDASIRWIIDDAQKYLVREARRERVPRAAKVRHEHGHLAAVLFIDKL